MYHAHFGLDKGLFGDGIATESGVFRSAKHDHLIASFKLALRSPSSAVVLRGPAGVGKTTLTSAALRASSTRLALAWLNGTPTNAAELLELVLLELGIGAARTTRMERLQLWRQFQAETRATESRLFVIVERTEDLSAEVLHSLDSLTAPDAAGNLGANVVLLGHAGIDEHLAAPVLDSLRQRIRLRAALAAFNEGELQDYLRHQIACAGGHYDHVFAPGSVAALYRHSGGVARLAKNLCETALDYAASQQHTLLTPELVNHTAVTLLGLDESAAAAPVIAAIPQARPDSAKTEAAAPARGAAPTAPTHAAETSPSATLAETAAVGPPAAIPAPSTPAAAIATSVAAGVPPAPAAIAASAAVAPAPGASAAPREIALAPPLATAPSQTPPSSAAVPFEYDGGATDITDVALADFPVLTDAVELPRVLPPIKRVVAVSAPPAPAPIAKPAAPSRIETAYAAKPAAPKPIAPPAPPAAVAQPAPPAPTRIVPADPESDDLLRQTQTMRAISVAKSIDDISSSMAETLFGDAELDLMTAALASAKEWPNDEQPAAQESPQPAPAPAKAQGPAPPPPIDDPFDLFGLGDDAPLELIDDSTLPPVDKARKTAAR